MTCDVCGNQTQLSIIDSEAPYLKWICRCCYAVSVTKDGRGVVARPKYLPIRGRWEQAVVEGPETETAHAYGFFGETLCGISNKGSSVSEYTWMPGRPNACPNCVSAAQEIDQRWPLEKRGLRMAPNLSPDADEPPF